MGDPGKKRKKKRKGSVTPFTQFSALSAGSAKPPRPLLEGSPCPRQSPRGPVVRFKAGGAGGPDVGCQDPRGTGDTVTSTAAEDVVAERAAAAQLEHQADIRKSLLYMLFTVQGKIRALTFQNFATWKRSWSTIHGRQRAELRKCS